MIDAHVERVRREGHVLSTAVLWVIGISQEGFREHLGVWTGASESRTSWTEVFRDLVQRGLEGVEYVVSDEHAGLVQALGTYFPEAVHQRCQVHYLRNALDRVSTDALRTELLDGLRDAWAAPTKAEAQTRFTRLIDGVRSRTAALADWLEETAGETLACYVLPDEHARKRLRTTNSIEHDHAEVRRRTRVIRIFPNVESLVRLVSALTIERNEQWMERRYLSVPEQATTREGALRHAA